MKRLTSLVAVVVLGFVTQAQLVHACNVPLCHIPEYEQCRAEDGTVAFQNCLARNRQEDARYQQCQEQRREECKQERQEQEREQQERNERAHEQYCQQHPDAPDCK
jgi:hypothetical protein